VVPSWVFLRHPPRQPSHSQTRSTTVPKRKRQSARCGRTRLLDLREGGTERQAQGRARPRERRRFRRGRGHPRRM